MGYKQRCSKGTTFEKHRRPFRVKSRDEPVAGLRNSLNCVESRRCRSDERMKESVVPVSQDTIHCMLCYCSIHPNIEEGKPDLSEYHCDANGRFAGSTTYLGRARRLYMCLRKLRWRYLLLRQAFPRLVACMLHTMGYRRHLLMSLMASIDRGRLPRIGWRICDRKP